MKEWSKEIEIDAPIEHVWGLFNGSVENMQKIMPQVVDHKPIKMTEEKVGSIYIQKYKEGNRIEEYEVTTLEFIDHPDIKKLKIGFTLANMFEITASYELIQIYPQKTLFKYNTTTKPLKNIVKLFLLFANDKVVVSFVKRVKEVSEKI